MNPYAAYLGDRDPLEVIRATPTSVAKHVARLGPERVAAPRAPGKWSPREVICHLADCELAFGFRIRQALAEPHHVMQPFDQDAWAKNYPHYTTEAALTVFAVLRGWNVALLEKLGPAELERPVTHPERGTLTLRVMVLETMAGHDRNHLEQFEALQP